MPEPVGVVVMSNHAGHYLVAARTAAEYYHHVGQFYSARINRDTMMMAMSANHAACLAKTLSEMPVLMEADLEHVHRWSDRYDYWTQQIGRITATTDSTEIAGEITYNALGYGGLL